MFKFIDQSFHIKSEIFSFSINTNCEKFWIIFIMNIILLQLEVSIGHNLTIPHTYTYTGYDRIMMYHMLWYIEIFYTDVKKIETCLFNHTVSAKMKEQKETLMSAAHMHSLSPTKTVIYKFRNKIFYICFNLYSLYSRLATWSV